MFETNKYIKFSFFVLQSIFCLIIQVIVCYTIDLLCYSLKHILHDVCFLLAIESYPMFQSLPEGLCLKEYKYWTFMRTGMCLIDAFCNHILDMVYSTYCVFYINFCFLKFVSCFNFILNMFLSLLLYFSMLVIIYGFWSNQTKL